MASSVHRIVLCLVTGAICGLSPGSLPAQAKPFKIKGITDAAKKRGSVKSVAASSAAVSHITKLKLSESLDQAATTVLRQHPNSTRWSGRDGGLLFGIAAERLPTGQIRQRVLPSMLTLSTVRAVTELLLAKSLLARYEAKGLSDPTTLRKAVIQSTGKLNVLGSVRKLTHQARPHGDYAVALVFANEDAIVATLFQPRKLAVVKASYRDVMHRQVRRFMARKNWADAVGLWRHLHQRKLVSPLLYIDASTCFKAIKKYPDVVRLVDQAMTAFPDERDYVFYEQAGDLLLDIETDKAQELAEKAYTIAGKRFSLRRNRD